MKIILVSLDGSTLAEAGAAICTAVGEGAGA